MRKWTERDKIAHILRRFGLGASESELEFYGKLGLAGTVDALLNFEKMDEGFDIPVEKFAIGEKKLIVMPTLQAWWIIRLLTTRRPLQEKLTLFWHDHFATSASKVAVPPLMYQQNETFRRNAVGGFENLLIEVSKDPAMLFWLDNQDNLKGRANENFAREVMELFTLGIGNYTEKDVQESARAFTGWAFRRLPPRESDPSVRTKAAEFLYRSGQHDTGEKTIFGKTGNFGGEDVISMLCKNPQTARYISTKIWEWFAYPAPEPKIVERLADKFLKNNLDIKVLLRSVMEAPEFYSSKAVRAIYKNPVDFVIPIARQLGVGEMVLRDINQPGAPLQGGRGRVQAIQQALDGMGMKLFFPPDVSGWESGPSWISSGTMVERIQWADRVFGQGSGRRAQIRYPANFLFTADSTPNGVVNRLTSLFDVEIDSKKVAQLVAAAKGIGGAAVSEADSGKVAATVCRLIFGSPEFQFC